MANEVTLNAKEAQKLGVIQETLSGRMTVKTAADIFGRHLTFSRSLQKLPASSYSVESLF